VFQGENEIDSSADWKNKVGFMKDPKRILRLIEMSLVLFGKAYLFNERNRLKTLDLRYLVPTSIEADITQDGLQGFKRRLNNGAEKRFEIEDVVYFWEPDPYVEIGPPSSSAATAAMAAAGVLLNTDEFAAAFFERGAIKATILSVPQGTQRDEKERLETWFQKVMNRTSNWFATKVLNMDAVTVQTIGEGIEGLENTELTKEKREDVATALGIPQSKLFSSSATDSNRQMDEVSLYRDAMIPEAGFIQEVLNEQVFIPNGYTFKFNPEALPVMQEDEEQRSAAFVNYRKGGLKPSITAEMLGLALPPGVEYEDLDEPEPEEEEALEEDDSLEDERENEVRQFHAYMSKRDKSAMRDFEFSYLDSIEQAALKSEYRDDNEELTNKMVELIDTLRDDMVITDDPNPQMDEDMVVPRD
jgi:hypothetical protein